jgi:Txe/YoeB family toxin of Txe-Axe toxin-antitoxin module
VKRVEREGARIRKIIRNLKNNNAKERGNFGDLQEGIIKMISGEIERENFEVYSVDSGNELSVSVTPGHFLNT